MTTPAEFELLPPAPKPLNKGEAQALHDKIVKSTVAFADETCAWLYQFDAGRGWEALGHASFKDYADAMREEVALSSFYNMRDKGAVDYTLTQATGHAVHLQMRHALAIKSLQPTQMVLAFKEAFGVRGANPTVQMIERIVKKFEPKGGKKGGGGKKKVTENNGWSKEDLEKDKELAMAFVALSVWGNSDVKSIKDGALTLNRTDIIFMAKLPKPRLMEIQDLVMGNRWTPQNAVKFLNTMPDKYTTVEDLQNYALATKGKFVTVDIEGFTITCKANRAARR